MNLHTIDTKAQNCSHTIALPLPPELTGNKEDMIFYARFMQHLRHVPTSKLEIKILSAIQFTADITDHSDAHVAKVLVELGLRAPRLAFPAEFLRFADCSLMRSEMEVGGPSPSLQALKTHWDQTGEDKFAPFRGTFDRAEDRVYI